MLSSLQAVLGADVDLHGECLRLLVLAVHAPVLASRFDPLCVESQNNECAVRSQRSSYLGTLLGSKMDACYQCTADQHQAAQASVWLLTTRLVIQLKMLRESVPLKVSIMPSKEGR